MEEQKPISADDYKNQPHLAEPGELVVIHGLVYKVLRHTWKPRNPGKKGRPVEKPVRVPRDLILRLLGIYEPDKVPAPPVAPPDHDHGPEFIERELPVPEVVLHKDQPVIMEVPPDVH